MMATIADVFWNQYAESRWTKAKADRMRRVLDERVHRAYEEIAADAKAHGGLLKFQEQALRLRVIRALDASCEYCANLFGIDTFGVVRRNPLTDVQGGCVVRTDWTLRAYAVCCWPCSRGKRTFTDVQWRGLLDQLRRCDQAVSTRAILALGGVEGTSPHPRPRG